MNIHLPEHLSSPRGVRVTRSLVLYVCFVDRCLSICLFPFDHCVVYSSSIYTDSDYPFGIFKLFLKQFFFFFLFPSFDPFYFKYGYSYIITLCMFLKGFSLKNPHKNKWTINNLYPYIWIHPFWHPWGLLYLLCTSDQQNKHKLCRGPSIEHSYQFWFQLNQWFQRRRLNVKVYERWR